MERWIDGSVFIGGTDLAQILQAIAENRSEPGPSFEVTRTDGDEFTAESPINDDDSLGPGDKGFDRELFIEDIRSLRCLWNTSTFGYKDRTIKITA